jgi:hypothetical protein
MSADLSLYDNVTELLDLLDEHQEAAPEHRGTLEAQIRAQIDRTRGKVDRIAAVLATLDAIAEAAATEGERLHRRAARARSQAEWLKNYVLSVMLESGFKKLEGNTNTLAMRSNPPAVDIWDEAAIPAEYQEVTTSTRPRKTDIKKAILAGIDVPGAKLVQGLSLRRS